MVVERLKDFSNPTGLQLYSAGWTDFALRSEPVAATWIL